MPDNSTYDQIEQLIRYMDGELSPEEQLAMQQQLGQDPVLQERLQQLTAARSAIKSAGLQQRVRALHQQFYPIIEQQKGDAIKESTPGLFRRIQPILRIAAILLLFVGAYGVYEYSTVSSTALYADNYLSYRLPVTRGTAGATQTDSLYTAGNYKAVITSVEQSTNRQARDNFLAGVACLETGDPVNAIRYLKALQTDNASAATPVFVQETEYYLALGYIRAGMISEAKAELELIRSNKQHMYYQNAAAISNFKLTLLEWKQ